MGLFDVKLVSKAAGLLLLAFANGVHLNVAEPANGFQVHTAHEAGAKDSCFVSNHEILLSEELPNDQCITGREDGPQPQRLRRPYA
jgi:hypothetical protein